VRTGSLSYEQRVWAAVLYAGATAAASHETALWLLDRRLTPPPLVHPSLPWPRSCVPQQGMAIHRLTRMDDDVHPVPNPRRLRVERAALETAAAAPTAEKAIATLAQVVQRRRTTAHRLLVVLERLPNLRRRALLREVLAMCGEGAHSLLEVQHERIRSGHGLPEPRRQVRHGQAVVDVDHGDLVIELDGRLGHLDAEGWWRDMLRDDMHTIQGRAVLRFPGFVLLTQPHVVAHLEGAALRRRGWTGSLTCPPGCPGVPAADLS
jgi:very-short-patch-repair endonuclease